MNTVSIPRGEATAPRPEAGAFRTTRCIRSTVTVLMCDIVSSTRLSTTLSAEAFRNLLLDYYRSCDDIVRMHSGHTVQYIGDGMLSVFGEPFVDTGTALDAVRAGLSICRQELSYLDHRYEIRAAASTGEIATGSRTGSGPALRDAVFGAAPYLAARLQTVAPPGSLVVDDSTFERIGVHFETRWMGLQELRGFHRPQPAWQVRAGAGVSPYARMATETGAQRFFDRVGAGSRIGTA